MPLTPNQRKQLARRIDQRRDALLAELREDAARAPVEVDSVDDADAARDFGELRALDAARVRLERARYGMCIDCAAEIPYARLKASPEALRCVPCQKRHDKTFAAIATPTL